MPIDFCPSGNWGEIRLAKAWAYQGWMGMLSCFARIPLTPCLVVDYDMWLGPAPKNLLMPIGSIFNFRWFGWIYCRGLMTDLGSASYAIMPYME